MIKENKKREKYLSKKELLKVSIWIPSKKSEMLNLKTKKPLLNKLSEKLKKEERLKLLKNKAKEKL